MSTLLLARNMKRLAASVDCMGNQKELPRGLRGQLRGQILLLGIEENCLLLASRGILTRSDEIR